MPHTASLPKMPDIPFPDSGAGPSVSDSQMEGLTVQPPFDAADVMSAATAPVSMNGYPAAQPSNIPAQVKLTGTELENLAFVQDLDLLLIDMFCVMTASVTSASVVYFGWNSMLH